MKFLYNFGIQFYYIGILIVSIFNKKAAKWISGRKEIFIKIKSEIKNDEKIVWFHCASLGEFEQGRPVIELLKAKSPDYKILITFFSPSGYEIRKGYENADYVYYLPLDTPRNAKKFINIVKPEFAVFVKYEFWFNFISQLKKKNIPVFYVSAIFRPSQHFFKWYGGWFSKMLDKISYFFVQNTESQELLNSIGITNVEISGDTRFDRVFEIAKQKKSFPLIEKFKAESEIIIAGSTWPADEILIYDLLKQDFENIKFIIAPHQVDNAHVDSIIKNIGQKVLKYSEATTENVSDYKILIIDSIGILNNLYQYTKLAYIGGGFGVSIHNIQEPATFANPVVFGPEHTKFVEAKDLIKLGGAFCVHNSNELIETVKKLLSDSDFYLKSSNTCKNYIDEKRGATEIIVNKIQVLINL
ncbi:MAG: 3-deoxy-D-manno-octulosonic acid transferase [Saprospiraceae bacterium]|nr:3-deoxy-D-manno-octulosonic acid transferase [Saprospiraceae bacterium]